MASDRNTSASPSDPARDAFRKVQRLRPLRVLLAIRDRRYMRLTCFLLARRGYEVVQDGGPNIADTAARWRADVVLFEPDSSRGATARTLAALAALPAPPAVLTVVGDSSRDGLPGVVTVRKWTPLEDLAREIDAASLRRGQPLAPNAFRI